MNARMLFVTLGLLPGIVSLHAQPPRTGLPFERIEHLKKVRLIEMLELNEDQSVRFFARFNEHENTKRNLTKEKDEALDKIDRLVRNHGDEKEFERVFAEFETVSRKIGDEKLRFFNSVSDILSPEQRGKLLLFERRFEQELREALREGQRRRHPGEE
jgi:Spy/CpxP family protein refolding chaperone